MDEQIELEKSEFKAKRFKELGFYPQKEIPANRLLPVIYIQFFFIVHSVVKFSIQT